ncbi:porin family protein [Maribacter sp. LLG6340-A2]|uniref:porin family protein n=1 Tax=Maribacter sp. LLG6340-A2 TaxID=3160834 RepID=UPI00386491EB
MDIKNFKVAVIIIIFISLPRIAFGQDNSIFGASLGLGLTNMTGSASETTNLSADIGYTIGINFEQEFSERTSLNLNLLYSRKNVRRGYNTLPNYPINQEKDYLKMSFDYIELPITIRYEVISQSAFFINGGVFFSYLLNTKLSEENNPPNLLATPWTEKVDYGLSFGIAKKISINQNNTFVLELRDNLGMKNLIDPDSQYNLKSNTLYFLVTWEFGK